VMHTLMGLGRDHRTYGGFRARSVPILVLLIMIGASAGAEGDRPEALLRDLTGKSSSARSRARKRLMELAGRDAPTVSRLFKGADDRAAERLARILGWTGDPRYVPPLFEKAKASSDAGLKGACIAALGAIGNDGALSVLRGLARHDDPVVRLRAAEALSASGGALAEKLLMVAGLDPDERVRKAAYSGLGEIGGVEAARFIAGQMSSASDRTVVWVAGAGGRILARHRGKGDDAEFEPASAAGAMENLAEALVDLAKDGPAEARAAAIRALGKAKVKLAAPALIEILQEPGFTSAANDALQDISGRDLPPDPDVWESWHHYATTRPEKRETDKKRSERLALPAEEDGRIELPPSNLARLKGSWKYALAAACALGVVVLLVLARSRQTRRWTEKIEAGRRKIRRSSS